MTKPGWDPRGKVYSTVWADKPWEKIGESPTADSPAGDREGNVYFSDAAANRIYKADADGKVTVFKENSNGATALRFGADGRLYAAQPWRKRIVSFGAAGDEKVVANGVEATGIALTAKGGIYFTDAVRKSVSYVDPGGKVRLVYNPFEIAMPFGVALSPDQAMLIVTDAQGRFSWSFQIAPDGGLVNGEPFYRLELPESGTTSGVRAVAVDSIGQVYFATPVGIQMCEANGRVAAILNPPEHGAISSFTFAGKDLNYLYVTEGSKLFRRPVKVTGTAVWSPQKPPKPPL
jgi:sugar lactone lactonase YvrE